jgi:type IV secretory pathway VirB9-like protein
MKRLLLTAAIFAMTVASASADAAPGQLRHDGVRYYPLNAQPTLTCAPNVMCEIILHPDEQVIEDKNSIVSTGLDGWIVRPVQTQEPHIFVSPMDATTASYSLTILTTKNRVYRIWLKAAAVSGLNVISFEGYPQDPPLPIPPPTVAQATAVAIALGNRHIAEAGGADTPLDTSDDVDSSGSDGGGRSHVGFIDPTGLHFDYTVTATKGTPTFKPSAVFNDGSREYIRIPDSAPLPAIVTDENRRVAFTFQDGYFVLGNLYDRLILATGTGRDRAEIQIVRVK